MFKQPDSDDDHGRSCPCRRLPLCLSSFTAAELGDVNSLQRRVKQQRERHKHQDWRVTDNAGNTPLHLAAQHGHVAATSFLLQGEDCCDVNAGSATPLHRASFSGAVATMRLLMDVASCDLLARDLSFGDLMTPLHKAASGGRYLAVQLLLLELETRQILSTALSLTDSFGHTPLRTARLRQSNVDSEAKSVARWNYVAGGPPDWTWCIRILEAAETSVLTTRNGMLNSTLPSPPGHLRTPSASAEMQAKAKGLSCLQCTDDEGHCRTKSWEIAFSQALIQTACPNLPEAASGHDDLSNSKVREDDSVLSLRESVERPGRIQHMAALPDDGERKTSHDRHSQINGIPSLDESSECDHSDGVSNSKDARAGISRPCVGMECEMCHESSLVLYPVKGNSMVCRSCSKGRMMRSNRR
jgi:Ankyrin repeats (3 copies)